MTMTEDAPAQVQSGSGPAAVPDVAEGKKTKKGKKDKDAKGKSNLVPAIVLALGLAAGGYFMGGGGGDASAADPVADAEPVAPEPGEVAVLESITVNLANDRFLRVGVAILTTSDFEVSHGGGHGDGDAPAFSSEHSSRLRDQLIAMFGGRDASSLVGPDQLDAAKEELLERANSVLDDHALEVYFTEFVMQ